MKKDKFFAIGVMSGTSFDGIDISLISSNGKKYFRPIKSSFCKFSLKIRKKIFQIAENFDENQYRLGFFSTLESEITREYVKSIKSFILNNNLKRIDLIGIHGQTIFHNPQKKISLQLCDANLLAKELKIKIVFDFRQNDLKFGGEGAPLVPIFHKMLVSHLKLKGNVIFINLGGISNLTYISSKGDLKAYDTGPGMTLLDEYVYFKRKQRFDRNGNFSFKGKSDEKVLKLVLKNRYFTKSPPKSIDKFYFSLKPFMKLKFYDACATISSFTAKSILREIRKFKADTIVITGGGVKNKCIVNLLKRSLKSNLYLINQFDLDQDFIEAQAFAYLAIRKLKGLPISFPGTTGTSHPVSGGKIVNYR